MKKHSLSFRYLWLGQATANIGDILIIVGLMPLLYQFTQSAFVMALVPVIKTLSSAFSASLSPIIFNLLNLKDTLLLSQLIKIIISVMLLMFLYFQWYESYIWITYLFIFIIGFFDGWSGPASKALIPKIVDKNLILKSNSWMESINQTIEVAIWSLGALLVALINIYFPFFVTIFLYIYSYILLSKIHISQKMSGSERIKEKKDWYIGWKEIAKEKDLKLLTLVELFITIANIIWLASFMYIYVEEVLHKSVEWWGYINSFLTGGILIGSIISYFKEDFLRKNFKLVFILTVLIMALSTSILAINSLSLIVLFCALFYGVSSQLHGLLEITYIQTNIDEKKLPFVYASQDVLNLLFFSIFTIILSLAIDFLDIRLVFAGMGLLIFLSLLLLLLYSKFLKPINNI